MHRNCPIITAAVGFLVLFIGIICCWGFPKLVDHAIAEILALIPGNMAFEIWKKPPIPVKFKIYFFNILNPDDVLQGAKPIVKEIGPYVFDEYWERLNVSVDDEADTITYMLKRRYFFNQNDSGCRSQNDRVTIINAGLLSTALQVSLLMPSMMPLINDAIPYLYKGVKDIFIRATVKEILFDGILITCHDPEVDFICSAMKKGVPPTMMTEGSDFRFSMFGYINTTSAGPFDIGRGLKNTTRGDILKYQGKSELDVWPGPTCNMINGSDGTLFYPRKTRPERIYTFGFDACRSIYVTYEKDVVFKGIRTWKYTSTKDSLVDDSPDQCFCPRVLDNDYDEMPECPKLGLFDVTYCLKGPILVSNPHFYQGDPSLLRFAKGLKPLKKIHENVMYFEPTIGSPIYGAMRAQMNVLLKPFEDIDLLNNVSTGVCPMLWVEETAVIPNEYLSQLLFGLKLLQVFDVFKWCLVGIGILVIVSSIVIAMYKERIICFANVASGKVATIKVKESSNPISLTKQILDSEFNSTILYPSLYPQTKGKNINDGLVRRNNYNNLLEHNTWQFKN